MHSRSSMACRLIPHSSTTEGCSLAGKLSLENSASAALAAASAASASVRSVRTHSRCGRNTNVA
jgi:hypothetical protein